MAPTFLPREPGAGRSRAGSCRRAAPSGSPTSCRMRRVARVRLRPRRQPGTAVSGGGEDRHVAVVPRQLDHRLLAPGHGGGVGRQLRSHAAAQLERRHGCGADLPCRNAGGRTPARRERRRSSRRRRWRRRPPTTADRARSARSRARRPTPGARFGAATSVAAEIVATCRAAGTIRATRGCSPSGRPSTEQWARERGLDDARGGRSGTGRRAARASFTGTDAGAASRSPAPAIRPLAIVSPPDGATYLIDPTLRREFQTLPLRAVSAGGGPIEWRVSGRLVGSARPPTDWPRVAARARHAPHRGARRPRPHERSHGRRPLMSTAARSHDRGRCGGRRAPGGGGLTVSYTLGWLGLPLMPGVAAAVAVAAGLLAARGRRGRTADGRGFEPPRTTRRSGPGQWWWVSWARGWRGGRGRTCCRQAADRT